MYIGFNYLAVGIISFSCLLSVVTPCNCKPQNCNTPPRTVTSGLQLKLKDKVTGNDIFNFTGYYIPIDDSIQLKNLSGTSYELFGGKDTFGNVLFTYQYNKPGNIKDTLVFYFGNSIPDTLFVETGMIDLSAYIDCDYSEPRITRVRVGNDIFYNNGMMDAMPVIRK